MHVTVLLEPMKSQNVKPQNLILPVNAAATPPAQCRPEYYLAVSPLLVGAFSAHFQTGD